MAVVQYQHSILLDDALPENVITNTFYFENPGGADTNADQAIPRIQDFFTRIDNTMFPATMANLGRIKAYDMSAPEPRVPFRNVTYALTPGTGAAMVNEASLCLSFQGVAESGEAQARRRGRVYLGLISSSTSNWNATTSGIRPSDALLGTVRDASAALMVVPSGEETFWVVYSPTTRAQGGTLGESTTPVANTWVDDTFDTQRRRGIPKTKRLVYPV